MTARNGKQMKSRGSLRLISPNETRRPTVDLQPTDPNILLPEQLAERLALPVPQIVELLESGELPGRRLGDQWRAYWPAVVASFEHDPSADVISVSVLAQRLGIQEATTRRLLADGILPGRQLGKSWFIWWPAVVDHLRSKESASEADAESRGGSRGAGRPRKKTAEEPE
jgi:excisionase family DNA binding protein